MKFGILGPVEARVDGTPVAVGGPRERKSLAALLLDANRAVPAARLVEVLWGDDPPATASAQLRNTMTALRRHLATAAGEEAPIVRSGQGFLIEVGPGDLDAGVFEETVTGAAKLAADDRLDEATDALRAALALWRGPALGGLDGAALEIEAYRWEERRLACLERRIELDLALGRHLEVVGELAVLVADHPLRERFLELRMLALYRGGRRQDALAAFAAARTDLAEQAGLDPRPELVELHQAILRDDPALLDTHRARPRPAPTAEPVAPSPVRRPPAQLPPSVRGFAGRTDELAALDNVLRTAGEHPTAVAIAVLWGTAGVGKTTLAAHWAHTVAGRFPDGQLYVNLRGFDPGGVAMSPSEAVRGLIDALGVPVERVPADLPAQAALYRSLLSERRMLVVLDNARDAEQVRPLLPGAPGCLVVVTSRNQLSGLVAEVGAHPITVGLPDANDARLLLARRLGQARVDAEPDAVDQIIACCARLPLALGIVAARAATHPDFPLADLAEELREARGGLDAFDSDDESTDVRAVMSWSNRALSPAAARLFRLLGLHAGPDISMVAAASLAGVPTVRARRLLGELTRAHLLTEYASRRFAFHDLLRAYAAEQVQAADAEPDRQAALRRVLDHYVHTAYAADRLLTPHRDPLALGQLADDVSLVELADEFRALAWFGAEQPVLLRAVEQAADHGFATHAWQLASMLTTDFDRRGHSQHAVATNSVALDAARRAGDRAGEARTLRGLAQTCGWTDRYDDAHAYFRAALAIYRELDDWTGQGRTLHQLTWLRYRQGRHDLALAHARDALDVYDKGGDRNGQAEALNAVGWSLILLGDPDQAVGYCERALAMHRELGDRLGQAATWDSIGYGEHRRGRLDEAVKSYEQAIALWRDIGDRFNEGETLARLGETHVAAACREEARRVWRQSVPILDEVRHPDADRVRTRLSELDGAGR